MAPRSCPSSPGLATITRCLSGIARSLPNAQVAPERVGGEYPGVEKAPYEEQVPDTRYAVTRDGVYLAYQTVGDATIDIAWQFDVLGDVDLVWEDDVTAPILHGLARFSRLILHDRRGTGLSSRNVAVPDLETRVSDLRVVLETVGSERPVLGGDHDGGSAGAIFAATQPDRVRSLVWYAPSARSLWTPDYPWGVRPDYYEAEQRSLELWGTAAYGRAFIETETVTGHAMNPAWADHIAKREPTYRDTGRRQGAQPDLVRDGTSVRCSPPSACRSCS